MIINFQDKTPLERYKLMSNLIIPRPIAWIVTEGEVVNIAPFSYFAPLSSEPPTLIVSIGHKSDGSPKDTLRNLRESKKCVVCIIDEKHLEPLELSAKELKANISETELFDIKTEKILDDFPPIPEGIKVAFFCEFLEEVELKKSKTIPIMIEVKHLYHDNKIEEFHAIGRVGNKFIKV